MDYFISFLEGFISFISPCILPLIPVYISYFAGQESDNNRRNALINSLGFVLGFTIIFVSLGAFAGSFGRLFKQYETIINIIFGAIIILFGLNFMQIIRLPFINKVKQTKFRISNFKFISSVLFGIIFSASWTPCVGVFLGSALMLAASSGESIKGILMLLSFSLGLGIPFIISAVLIDKLKTTFNFIKKHYRIINIISGSFLVLVGILIATNRIGYLLSLLTF